MPSGPPKERRRRHGKAQPRRLASPPPTRAATASVSPPDSASRTRPPKPRHPESAHHLDHSRPSKPPGSRTLPGGAAWGHALPQRRGLAPAHHRPRQAPGGAASSLPQAQDPAFFHATKPTLATSLAASANDAHGTPPRHGLAPVSTTRRRCVLPASAPSCTRRSASLKPAATT